MYPKAGYTIVGIFVVLFGVGLVWFAFWLSHATGDKQYKSYKLFMQQSVSGLSRDAMVKLHGVDIGRVTAIGINPAHIDKVEIDFIVEAQIPLKEDMVATTQMVGVTGMLIIEISGGSNGARTLKEGESLQTKPSFFSAITAHATPMLKEIHTLAEKSNRILTQGEAFVSAQNAAHFSKILANVAALTSRTDKIEKRLFRTLDEVDSTLQKARKTMDTLNPRVVQVSEDFHRLTQETLPLLQTLQTTVKDVGHMTKRIDGTIVRGEYNLKKIFQPMVIDIQILVQQIGEISRKLEQNPSDLIFGSRKKRKAPGE